MEKMKLNIQLFGATVTLTATETAVDDTAINTNQTYINLSIRVQTTKPTWNGNKTAYYQVTTTSQNNGTQTGSKYYFSIGSSTGSGDKTFNVQLGAFDHNADGTLNDVSISVYVKITDSTNRTATKSVAMATIPRASQPTTSASVTMGNAVTINTNRYSSSFTHTLTYAFGGTSGTIGTNVGASVSWTPPLTLANQIPSATSGVATITCVTYSNGVAIGTKTTTITLNVPTSVVPTISSLTLQENGDVPSSWGVYVQNKSKIKVTYSASGSYGSTISSYTTTGDGYTYSGNPITTNYIRTTGNITLTGKVVDSRGRQATKNETRYIYPYSNPTISTAQIQRCDVDGNVDNNGEYCLISYGASISSCNGNNPATYKVSYRVHNVGNYVDVPLATNVVSYSASGMLYTDGIYAANRGSGTKVQFSSLNTYDIQFYVADYFTNLTNLQLLDTGFDLMNFNANGKAMAIGKVSEAGADTELFEVGMRTEINGPLVLRNYNNAVMIGDQNNAYVHFNSSENKNFYFNKSVSVNGNVYAGSNYNRQLAFKDETWYNGIATPSNDLNNAIHNGCYYWVDNTSNRPSTSLYGWVLTTNSAGIEHNNTDNWCSQIGFGTDGNVYYRNKTNNSSWGVWRVLTPSRTITFNGEWRHATKAYGTGWFMFVSLNNPTKNSLTNSITSCEYFGTGGWKTCTASIGEIRDTEFKINFSGITDSETQNGIVLIRMVGSITLNL